MKLEVGKTEYDVAEPIGLVLGVLVGDEWESAPTRWHVLDLMHFHQVEQLRAQMKDHPGRPRYVAKVPERDRLILAPPPDKPYELKLRFYPPVREIYVDPS
jgi:hypothetical protein